MKDVFSSIPGFTKGLPEEKGSEKVARNARGVFMETLESLVKKDKKVILIVGDVGFSYMTEFKKKYPELAAKKAKVHDWYFSPTSSC